MLAENITPDLDTILVDIKDTTITYQDLLDHINSQPSKLRNVLMTKDGQRLSLEILISEALFYLKAVQEGVDQRPEVLDYIHMRLRPLINLIYFEGLFENETIHDPKRAERYYYENIHRFTEEQRVNIMHLQTSPYELSTVRSSIERGVDFRQLIDTYSINPVTSQQMGVIQNIRLNGFISGIGHDTQLDKHISDAIVSSVVISRHTGDMPVYVTDVHGPFETSTGIHFFKILSYEPQQIEPFEDVKDQIEELLLTQTKGEFYRDLMRKLYARYDVKVSEESLDIVNHYIDGIYVFSLLPQFAGNPLVTGLHPDIEMTLGDLGALLSNIDLRERIPFNERGIRDIILRREINSRVMRVAAGEDNIPELHQDDYLMASTRAGVIREAYFYYDIGDLSRATPEEILYYYENNMDKYTVPAYRSILQFVAKDKKTANTHRKLIAPMLKRNELGRINTHISSQSLNRFEDANLKSVFRDDIIPGLGTDAGYNKRVWSAKVGDLSPIFKNRNNEYVFFTVVREIPQRIIRLTEVEADIADLIYNRKFFENTENKKHTLMDEYGVVRHFDRLISLWTAEELFALAQEAQIAINQSEAIFFLDQIILEYPDTNYGNEASFMKAFLLSENAENRAKAIETLVMLLEKNPSYELRKAAEGVLDALRAGTFGEIDIYILRDIYEYVE
jgi:hypothetical protein